MTEDDSNADHHFLQATPSVDGHCIAPALDESKYRPYLAELSLTREQEDTLLRTLWTIMSTFVDLGFGLDSVQTVFNAVTENALSSESDSLQQEKGPEVRETFRQVTAETHKKEMPQ